MEQSEADKSKIKYLALKEIVKRYYKPSAALWAVFGFQGTVLLRDNHSCKRKADAYTMFGGVFALIETLEEMGKVFFGESGAVIFYDNPGKNRVLRE